MCPDAIQPQGEPQSPCYVETVKPHERTLYDRKQKLDEACHLLHKTDRLGIWVVGAQGSDRTSFVVNVARRCTRSIDTLPALGVHSYKSPTPDVQFALFDALSRLCSEDDLATICLGLGIDYEDLGGKGRTGNARELVTRVVRHRKFGQCLETADRVCPDPCWSQLGQAYQKDTGEQAEDLFQDGLYFSPQNYPKAKRTCFNYMEFASLQLATSTARWGLLIIDDLDDFDEEQKLTIEYLERLVQKRGWKAIVASSESSEHHKDPNNWHTIDIQKLDPLSTQEFVRDFFAEAELDIPPHPKRQELLDFVNSIHDPQHLQCALERVEQNIASPQEALKELREFLRSADPIESAVWAASKDLSENHLQILKTLLLVETSITPDMLSQALMHKCEPSQTTSWLADLEQRKLVERTQNNRYQIRAEKRPALTRICAHIRDPFLHFAFAWLDYAQCGTKPTPVDHYAKLDSEHENLLHLLDKLWKRSKLHYSAKGDPPPFNAFEKPSSDDQKRSLWLYQLLYRDLRDYLYYAGRWHDFECESRRAYVGAHAAEDYRFAAWRAADVATVLSLAGRCTQDELKQAEQWVDRITEVARLLDDKGELPATAERLRGIIALRRCQYKESHDHLKQALGCLEYTSRAHLHAPGLHDLLAKRAMRCCQETSELAPYQNVHQHLNDGLAIAKSKDQQGDVDVMQTRRAELLIWQGKWDEAQQVLETELELPKEPKRKDIWAKGLRLLALVYQHRSTHNSKPREEPGLLQSALTMVRCTFLRAMHLLTKHRQQGAMHSPRASHQATPDFATAVGEERTSLDKAIQHAKEALTLVQQAQMPDRFLTLADTYLILAALHQQRCHMVDDDEGQEECAKCRSQAQYLLDYRRDYYPMEPDPDVLYEAACLAVLDDDCETAGNNLRDALKHAPGFYGRAQHDFRLQPLFEDEWRKKWDANYGQDTGVLT